MMNDLTLPGCYDEDERLRAFPEGLHRASEQYVLLDILAFLRTFNNQSRNAVHLVAHRDAHKCTHTNNHHVT